MVITQMIIGRLLVFVLAIIAAIYIAFTQTPELDGVTNAWVYRVSYGMLILRAFAYTAFDMFGLFPLDGVV